MSIGFLRLRVFTGRILVCYNKNDIYRRKEIGDQMLRIAICDDKKDCRTIIARYCENYCLERKQEFVYYEYDTGEQFLETDKETDIVFLDIEMQGMDGLQVKDILCGRGGELRIIFVSGHEEAIPDAFGRRVYGFLRKPFSYEAFAKKLDVALADFVEQEIYIACKNRGNVCRIEVSRILFIQADGKYTKIFLWGTDEYVFSDQSIGSWKQELCDNDFGMCHRSYLVHFPYIKNICQEILVADGSRIPVSRRMEREFRDAYRQYVWRKAR